MCIRLSFQGKLVKIFIVQIFLGILYNSADSLPNENGD